MLLRVKAFARIAILVVLVRAAAIPAIPAAAAVVIGVVAVAVCLPLHHRASLSAGTVARKTAVQTLTILGAVLKIVVGSAAVATVPIAACIVVISVAEFVAFPGRLGTGPVDRVARTWVRLLGFTIFAGALSAVVVLRSFVRSAAAIAAVPGAPGVVVVVVAEPVLSPRRFGTATSDGVARARVC